MPRHKATPKKHENDLAITAKLSTSNGKKIVEKCRNEEQSEEEEDEESVSISEPKEENDLVLDLSVKRCGKTIELRENASSNHKRTDKSVIKQQQQNHRNHQKDGFKNRTPYSDSTSKPYADLTISSTSSTLLDIKSLYSAAALSSRFFPNLIYPHQSPQLAQPLASSSSSSSSSSTRSTGDAQPSTVDCLSKLTNLVSKVGKCQSPSANNSNGAASAVGNPSVQDSVGGGSPGNGLNFQELWWRFVKKEENAEIKRLNEAKQIFTCLQCQASFQTMDQLVKHMENTQHYANIPKHYSWSLQYARQKMRQMKMKMKYSDKMMYFCFLCQAPFTEPVHVHFNYVHSMHNPAENMKFVQIISVVAETSKTSPATSHSSLGKRKSNVPTAGSSPAAASVTSGGGGSDCQSPQRSVTGGSTTPFSTCSRLSSPEKPQIEFPAKSKRSKFSAAAAAESSAYDLKDNVNKSSSLNLLSKMEAFVHNAVKERSK